MKKILLVLLITLLSLGFFVACSEGSELEEILPFNEAEAYTQDEIPKVEPLTALPSLHELCDCGSQDCHDVITQPTSPLYMLPFNWHALPLISQYKSEFLNSFETAHEFTYRQYETDWHHTLIIWTDTPLSNFSFVTLGFEDIYDSDDRSYFYIIDTLFTLELFQPTDVIVLNVAFSHYLIPHGGLIFTDENGVQRRMFISENMELESSIECIFHRFVLLPHNEHYFSDWDWFSSQPCDCETCRSARLSGGVTSAGVHIRFIADETRPMFDHVNEYVDIGTFEHYHTFIESGGHAGMSTIITAEKTVTDFQFLSLHYSYQLEYCCEEPCICIFINYTLFSLDELTSEMPLFVTWNYMHCFTSGRGISFVYDGVTRYFDIFFSNYNGHLFLREFEPRQQYALNSSFTIAQIQTALMPQFQIGNWGEGNPRVVSAERIEREIDSFFDERDGSIYDLSNAYRYRVSIRYKQSFEEYLYWTSPYGDYPDLVNPFEREGDYTTLTTYYYFTIENGILVLPFVMC
jgi:hypothetical protein